MVVILLVSPPYTQNDGCDEGAGSNDSSTSTGDTAIPAYAYRQQQQQQQQQYYYYYPHSSQSQNSNRYTIYGTHCCCHCCQQQQQQHFNKEKRVPPLPKSQPPYDAYYGGGGQTKRLQTDKWLNAPGHTQQQPTNVCTYTILQQQQKQQKPEEQHNFTDQKQRYKVDNDRFYASAGTKSAYSSRANPQQQQHYRKHLSNSTNNNINNYNRNQNITSTSDFVRHVTRVNFYDVDTSQVEFESKDNNNQDDNEQQLDTEAITKEGELSIDSNN